MAQIKKEEQEKRKRRLESINVLKTMGYSTYAAKHALHQARGNLDEALKVRHPHGPLTCPTALTPAQAPPAGPSFLVGL